MPSPYGPSTVISGVTFSGTISRAAAGSDNWPVTWGDDGEIYTAYGDGWGFESIGAGGKLSCATAKVSGTPTTYVGTDLGTIQSTGSPNRKATGIICVGGVLYAWVRDEGGLWKSTNHGTSWTEVGVELAASGAFEQIAFVQFGQDNAGAPGGYVYCVAMNQAQYADDLVLFRMLPADIETPANYEYITSLADLDNPTWGAQASRISIFTYTDHIAGPRLLYNAGMDRYLLTIWFGESGGIGLFDSEHLWGPWTTVYWDDQWDQGFTFEYDFPTKWISGDGTQLWMVFSGITTNDAWCLRETTLSLFSGGNGGGNGGGIGGSGVSGPFKITEMFPVTAGSVWGGWHQGAGAQSKEDAGIQVLSGLSSDATVSFRQVIGDTLPNGTAYLVLHAMGNISSGIARVEVLWALVNPAGTLTSLVNGTFRWLASGSGTNEFYNDLLEGGNPSIASPNVVYIDGDPQEKGTLGSLAAGTWGFGDNDTIGNSRIYVRLADGADPDSKATDFVQALTDVGGEPSSVTLNSEGIFEVEWTTADADNYIEILIPLNAISWAARRIMTGQIVFKGQAGWPAAITTWKAFLEWK